MSNIVTGITIHTLDEHGSHWASFVHAVSPGQFVMTKEYGVCIVDAAIPGLPILIVWDGDTSRTVSALTSYVI